MAPRKRAKASAASTPLTEPQPKTPQDTGPARQSHDPSSPPNEDRLNDPWTDDQETQLFKSMIKWKPTGMHKHFRMISIHNNMRSLGYATDDAQHTRIPGVWRKLHQLYDLHALDERENSYAFHDLPDPLDPDDAHQIPEFELPEEEFGELMWQRRYRRPGSEPSSSPPFYPIEEDKALYQPGLGLLRELPEGAKPYRAGSTSVATPTPKGNRNTRASRAATKAKGKKGGQAKNIKAQSAVSESAGEDEEVDGDEDEDQDEEESAESQVETAPSTRRTNRSGGRAKPAPKRTRKR